MPRTHHSISLSDGSDFVRDMAIENPQFSIALFQIHITDHLKARFGPTDMLRLIETIEQVPFYPITVSAQGLNNLLINAIRDLHI